MPIEPRPPRRRLRLDTLEHDVAHDGRSRMTVRLEWAGTVHEASVQGLETHQGRLRAVALATVEAVLSATDGGLELDLAGVKSVRAFDGWVVIVRVNAVGGGRPTRRLLGAAPAEDEEGALRATAQAVLDAVNRVTERHMEG